MEDGIHIAPAVPRRGSELELELRVRRHDRQLPHGRGLHSSTSPLDVSMFGDHVGCILGYVGCSGGFSVENGSELAEKWASGIP